MAHRNNQSDNTATSSSGVLFWIFLFALIFVLYCLSLQRPYCRTLEGRTHGKAIHHVAEPSAFRR